MKELISREAAEEELQAIIDFWEVDPEGPDWESSRRRLINAIIAGRITLNKDTETMKMSLVKPIELANGESVSGLDLREPTAREFRVMDKYKEQEQMAKTIALASAMIGQPIAVAERMCSRDLSTFGALASLFT